MHGYILNKFKRRRAVSPIRHYAKTLEKFNISAEAASSLIILDSIRGHLIWIFCGKQEGGLPRPAAVAFNPDKRARRPL